MLSALFLATVIGISDGDTLTVLNESKQQVKIRLAEVDAPEARQPFGTKSKHSLSELWFGKQAQIKPRVKDQYGRTVARQWLSRSGQMFLRSYSLMLPRLPAFSGVP